MYSTYQMMSNATNKQYLDKTLEELVEDYKKPNVTMSVKNKIFAAMFVKLFPMMLKIQQKYYTITNEQKVDHAIFHLHRSIYHYKNNNVKFSSFFHTHFCNQMKTLLNCENNLKNAVFQNIVKDNENILKWYNNTAQSKTYSDTERYLLFNIKNCSFLSSEDEGLAYRANLYLNLERGQMITGNFIGMVTSSWKYSVFYVLFAYSTNIIYKNNLYDKLPVHIRTIYNFSFALVVFSTMMYMFNIGHLAFYYRYLMMLYAPLTIVVVYLFQNNHITRYQFKNLLLYSAGIVMFTFLYRSAIGA